MAVPHGIDRSGAAGGSGSADLSTSLNELADPGADRILFWDDSADDLAFLSLDTGLAFSNAVLAATFLQSGSGATTRLTHSKLRDTVSIQDFGAVADGATDDSAALQAAVNTGKLVSLNGASVGIGSQITWAQNGGGIVGPGHIVMLTGVGQFQETVEANKYQTDACGIYVLSFDDVVFRGFKMSLGGTPNDDSVCMAIALRDSLRSTVQGCDFTGFRKADGIIAVDSSFDCAVVDNYIHDCEANGLTNGQLSGVNVDDNRVASVASERLNISRNRIANLTVDATFLATNGYQTDGINVSNAASYAHTIVGNAIDTVGEGIDCFGSYCTIAGNTITDAYLTGIKLIHGASYNAVVGNTITGLCKYGINLAGGEIADTTHNLILGNVISGVNSASNHTSSAVSAGVACDNSGTFDPESNLILGNIVANSPKAHWGLRAGIGASQTNEWIGNRLYGAFVTARVYNDSSDYFSAGNKSYVRAYRNTTAQTVSTATLTTIIFNAEDADTNGEYDTSTGIFTASEPRRMQVVAAFRSSDGVTSNSWALVVSVNNGLTQRLVKQCVMVGGEDSMSISAYVNLAVGDTLRIKVQHDKGSDMTLTADTASTYLNLTEI